MRDVEFANPQAVQYVIISNKSKHDKRFEEHLSGTYTFIILITLTDLNILLHTSSRSYFKES